MLEWYAQIASDAKKPLFMTFAFGINKGFQKVYAQNDGVLRLALMEKEGAKDRSWESIRTFVTEHKETLQASIKRDPLDGLRGVDYMFEQADSWAAKLKSR